MRRNGSSAGVGESSGGSKADIGGPWERIERASRGRGQASSRHESDDTCAGRLRFKGISGRETDGSSVRSLQIEPLAGQGTPIITFCLGNPLYVFNGFTVVDVVSASGPVSLGHEF